ncbi:phosphoserine phosphatase SerB [Brackiella oedipodis]|uniref:phosphoserine phosphatase SerB n=1 Tax=Brackiella oedipodis TaxID=124225 RepID=UPI0006859588|nr:phosphoserine phosphatase SerB [Brackiella oedipodis]
MLHEFLNAAPEPAAKPSNCLLLQSPALDDALLEQAAALLEAETVKRLHNYAVRFFDVAPAELPSFYTWAEQHKIDYALLEHLVPMSQIKLIAMDMDSTLINIECIDEIAAIAGRKAEVAAITEAAMRGEIKDFAESLRRRVALLKGVPATALEAVFTQKLRLNPGAQQLIQTAQKHGIKTLLVSGGFTFFTERLQQQLGLDYAYANELAISDGVLTGQVLGPILDGAAKAAHLQALAKDLDLTPENCIAMGDGSNDLPMMRCVAYSFAYCAKPAVQAQARFKLNHNGLNAALTLFE